MEKPRNGEYKEYYENGQQIYEHCFYKDGKLDGEYKDYYENGQLEEHRYYNDDKEICQLEYEMLKARELLNGKA